MITIDRTHQSWMTGEVAELFELSADFFEKEAVPQFQKWRDQKRVDREFWNRAGEVGLLCPSIPTEYGGGGGSFLHFAAVAEAVARSGDRAWSHTVHSGIVAHYILDYGTEEQKRRWLPKMATGEFVGAIAMTEPSAGSDLKAIRTTAEKQDDAFVINGSKTFISNGQNADLIIVVAKTDPSAGAHGISLIVVETDEADGFTRGRTLDKIGQKAADTSELFFDDVRVPVGNLLGEEDKGFYMLMSQLRQERLIIGITSAAASEAAVRVTTDYVNEREAFGAPLIKLQNTRFELAECATLARVGRVFLDDCINRHMEGKLGTDEAAMCKWWLTDVQCQIADHCLQLFGGYGYVLEYPIAHLFADSRVQKIYGGANEVQKELIARSLDRTKRKKS
jgi:acyl-CoA dehydrogenase